MRYPSWLILSALCALGLAVPPVVRAEKLVLANSQASRDYLQKRVVDGKRQPQRYVFMAGRYLAGITHDNSLDKTSFRTIAEQLAVDLRAQDFSPAPSLARADLLLVVHWGVTVGRNRDSAALVTSAENLASINVETEVAQKNLEAAIAAGNLEEAGRARDNLTTLTNEAKSEYQDIANDQNPTGEDSAALLGLSAALAKDDQTLFDYERRQTLSAMTREECYFVVVMAYDARALVGAKQLKRVWTLRASMSSAGVNFREALDRIRRVGGQYFGTKQESVAFDYPAERKRKERVDIGELTVIGPAKP
jgi:hypothetical protein